MFNRVEPTNMANNASKYNVWWHQSSEPCHIAMENIHHAQCLLQLVSAVVIWPFKLLNSSVRRKFWEQESLYLHNSLTEPRDQPIFVEVASHRNKCNKPCIQRSKDQPSGMESMMISKEMQSSRFKLDADMAMAEMYPKSSLMNTVSREKINKIKIIV